MKKGALKRISAMALVICFVLTQMSLPSGIFDLSGLAGVIKAKAASDTFEIAPDWIQVSATTGEPVASLINQDGILVPFSAEVANFATKDQAAASLEALHGVRYTYRITKDATADEPGEVDLVAINTKAINDAANVVTDKLDVEIHINETVKDKEGRSYKVVQIGDSNTTDALGCFGGLTRLKTVYIPDSVKKIASNAFAGNPRLGYVIFNKTSQLEEIGDNAFQKVGGDDALHDLELPGTLKRIGNNAFEECKFIKSVVIASSSTNDSLTIGTAAFKEASNLDYVVLPEYTTEIGQECFYKCSKLRAVNIPKNLTEIPAYAFYDCSEWILEDISKINKALEERQKAIKAALEAKQETDPDATLSSAEKAAISATFTQTSSDSTTTERETLKIPANITAIGSKKGTSALEGYAFYNCTGFDGVDLSAATGIKVIEPSTFENCTFKKVKFEETPGASSITEIKEKAFYNNAQLDGTFVMPQKLVTLGKSSFEGTGIPGINWNGSLPTEIGDRAFANSKLTYIIFPKSVTKIPASVCENPINGNGVALGIVTIPSTVTEIGDKAFLNCSNLSTLKYYNEKNYATAIGLKEDEVIEETESNVCKLDPTLADSKLKEIGASAFENTILDRFVMPTDMETISENTFAGCKLDAYEGKGIRFNDKVKSIGKNAFANSQHLKEVTVPATVKEMGEGVFSGGKELTKATLECSAIKTLGSNEATGLPGYLPSSTFSNCPKLQSAVLSDAFTALGGSVFEGCGVLDAVTMPGADKITVISANAFKECKLFAGFSGDGSIVFPKTLSALGSEAFNGCQALKQVDLSNTEVTSIDNNTFYGTGVEIAELPKGLTSIAEGAFAGLKTAITKMSFNNYDNGEVSNISPTAFCTIDENNVSKIFVSKNVKITVPPQYKNNYLNYFSGIGLSLDDSNFISGATRKTSVVTLNYTTLPICAGQEIQLATTMDKGASDTVMFTSSDSSIVQVSADGIVKARKLGKATITATAVESKVSATCEVTVVASGEAVNYVKNPISTITFENIHDGAYIGDAERLATSSKALYTGDQAVFQVDLKNAPNTAGEDAPVDTITWTLTDPITGQISYASETGNTLTVENQYVRLVSSKPVNGKANVTVTILGECDGNVIATCTSYVTQQDMYICINKRLQKIDVVESANKQLIYAENATVDMNSYFTFNPSDFRETVSYTTNNPNVATIDEKGILTMKGYGDVTITVTGNKTSTVSNNVTLNLTIDQLAFEQTAFSLYTAGPYKTAAVKITSVLPAGAAVTFESEDPSVAAVDASGNITGVKQGTTNINAVVFGKKFPVSVAVTKATLMVTVPGAKKKKTTYTISKKVKKFTLEVSANYLGDKKQKITYKSSKKKVASINKKGLVKLKKKGTTKLTVTCNGVKKTITLKVKK